MRIIPEFLEITLAAKIQLTPVNIAMVIALGLCMALVWRYFKGRTK